MIKNKNISTSENILSKKEKKNYKCGSDSFLCTVFRLLVHLIAVLHHSYAIYYFSEYVNIPESVHPMGNRFGGKFKYLTFLNLIIQAIYFKISLMNDIIGSNDISSTHLPRIRLIRDHLFSSLAYPVNIDVGVVFWILYSIDRELVLPKSFDPYFPVWLNHMIHTNILFFIILELFLSFRLYPKRLKGLRTLMIFLVCYLIWVHIIKYASGIWVYPVLDVFNLQQRIAFFAGMLIWSAFVYLTGEYINNRIWYKKFITVKQKTK